MEVSRMPMRRQRKYKYRGWQIRYSWSKLQNGYRWYASLIGKAATRLGPYRSASDIERIIDERITAQLRRID